MLPTVAAIRYVAPLREGGSLPALMEADDLGTYVVKFTGAGQGRKALIAEIVAGGLARRLGLAVPDLVLVEVDPVIAPAEPDQEVQDLLRASPGINLGMDYLPGSIGFDPRAFTIDADLASRVLWFDALVGNMDRSWRNPNLLMWHGRLWLIDHGATLIFHHNWPTVAASIARPYEATTHALQRFATDIAGADRRLRPLLTPDLLGEVVAEIPDAWLIDEPGFADPGALRQAYVAQLSARAAASPQWLPKPAPQGARL